MLGWCVCFPGPIDAVAPQAAAVTLHGAVEVAYLRRLVPVVNPRREPMYHHSRFVPRQALSLLGIDAHVIRRVKALKLLGVTEEDLAGVGDPRASWRCASSHQLALTYGCAVYMDPESLNRQRAFFRAKYPKQARKILQLLGATEGDVLREKALRRLGTSDAMVKVRCARRV